jgi:hypothetical protein
VGYGPEASRQVPNQSQDKSLDPAKVLGPLLSTAGRLAMFWYSETAFEAEAARPLADPQVGRCELCGPQDRAGRSRPSCSSATSDRRTPWWGIGKMYGQRVSTPRRRLRLKPCTGMSYPHRRLARSAQQDACTAPTTFARRRLAEPYPYTILDAREDFPCKVHGRRESIRFILFGMIHRIGEFGGNSATG